MPTAPPLRDTERLAGVFHALSDRIRLDIVALLMDGERCVCDLAAELEVAQSTLSWHLRTLKDAGVIGDRREGRWNYYTLHADVLAEARDVLGGMHASAHRVGRSTGCC